MTAIATSPPGVTGLASLAELRALRQDQLAWVVDRRARWGDVFALQPPTSALGPLFVFACAPAPIRSVLTDPATYPKSSPVYEEMADVLGDGLLTSEGDRWRAQRRTLQPLFTRRRVTTYAGAFVDAARSVVETWPHEAVVDLDEQMQRVSLRSVGVTLFGTDVTDQIAPIVAATDAVSAAVVRRGTSPVRVPTWLPVRDNRDIRAGRAELQRRFDQLIDDRRRDGPDGDDLLSLLLTVEDPETGERLDHEQVRDQVGIMLLAGYDTTSTAMTFALHLLGQHPAWQDAVREEVRGVLGPPSRDAGRRLSADDVPDLSLTRRVLDEAMRLHPSAYITSRSATRDTEVGGHAVPAGSVVATSFHALHRHPEVWPDPDRFDPDRFLPERVGERDPYAHLPFGGGPRSCIGNHFALLEATLALATIVDQVAVAARTDRVPVTLGITQRPSGAVPCHVTRTA